VQGNKAFLSLGHRGVEMQTVLVW